MAHLALLAAICDVVHEMSISLQGLPVHLDGARVFNAAVALGVPVSAIADLVTSVQFCLSKVWHAVTAFLLKITASLCLAVVLSLWSYA